MPIGEIGEELAHIRALPLQIQVRHPPAHHDDVHWAIAYHLIGERYVSVERVADTRIHHPRSIPPTLRRLDGRAKTSFPSKNEPLEPDNGELHAGGNRTRTLAAWLPDARPSPTRAVDPGQRGDRVYRPLPPEARAPRSRDRARLSARG